MIWKGWGKSRLSEDARRQREALIAAILGAISDVIYVKDRQGRYLLVTQPTLAFLGKTAEEVLGHDDTSFLPPQEARAVMEGDRAVMEAGETRICEESFTTVGGLPRYFLTTKGPVRDGDGAVVGLFGIAHDITGRVRSEAALARMQNLESLGTLAGGIAHNFNNVLTAILGNITLLESITKENGEARAVLKEAQAACAAAKDLSNQLLTFAKGGSPVVSVMDLNPLMERAASLAARGTSARCVFDLGDSPLAVNVDGDQIAQAVSELVLNAIQAMPKGGEIAVRAASVVVEDGQLPNLAAGRYVRVSVADGGGGIPPELHSKIFDPYFTTRPAGRGLGLSLCHSIMARHGGSISVDSKSGAGATFTLHFPAADPAAIPARPGRERDVRGRSRASA